HHRWDRERDSEPHARGGDGDGSKQRTAVCNPESIRGLRKRRFSRPMAGKQKRQQTERGESIIRQRRFYQRKNDEDECDAGEEITVDVVPLAPQSFQKRGQSDRPRKETDKNGHEIKRQ